MNSADPAESTAPRTPAAPPPKLFRPRRRGRGWLLLGVILPLVAALILLEMKNTRLAEENQNLTAQNTELLEKSAARESAETAALKSQLGILRRKIGLLEIEDASKLYAVSLEADANAIYRYRWRVFIPSDGKFAVKCAVGTELKELPCKPGEQTVVLSLTKRTVSDQHPMLFFGSENDLTGLTTTLGILAASMEPDAKDAKKEVIELYSSSQTSPETTSKGLQLFKGKIDAEGSATPRSTPITLSVERTDR